MARLLVDGIRFRMRGSDGFVHTFEPGEHVVNDPLILSAAESHEKLVILSDSDEELPEFSEGEVLNESTPDGLPHRRRYPTAAQEPDDEEVRVDVEAANESSDQGDRDEELTAGGALRTTDLPRTTRRGGSRDLSDSATPPTLLPTQE